MSYHLGEASAPARLGRYELLGQLATGGMAEIHLAKLAGVEGFEKIVVVKRLLPELVASKAFVAMLLDEGKLAARLDHPNVCEVFELGRDGAEYFLVMPYLDGVPATDFVARPRESDRAAQLRVACGIVVQACAGLHHAHELRGADGVGLGLVHRDVSPSNLFVTTAGVVKVLDFGIAKVRGATNETEAGTIKGKTQYMAPEQLLGEELDRRCDVFALGIVLFELATHQRLFKRGSDYLAAKAVLEDDIPRADAVDPAVPAALADVIAKALARKKADRFADAKELARAIEAAVGKVGGVANADEIAGALAGWHGDELSAMRTRQARVLQEAKSQLATLPRSVPPAAAAASASTASGGAGRARRGAVAAAVGVAVVAAAGGWWFGIRDGGASSGSASSTADDTRLVADDTRLAADDTRLAGDDTTHATGSSNGSGSGSSSGSGSGIGRGSGIRSGHRQSSGNTAGIGAGAGTGSDAGSGGSLVMPEPRRTTGFFSIDSDPYATIFVDSKKLGITPLLHVPLPAGHHRVRAVLSDGRAKDLDIDVPARRQAKPVRLSW